MQSEQAWTDILLTLANSPTGAVAVLTVVLMVVTGGLFAMSRRLLYFFTHHEDVVLLYVSTIDTLKERVDELETEIKELRAMLFGKASGE